MLTSERFLDKRTTFCQLLPLFFTPASVMVDRLTVQVPLELHGDCKNSKHEAALFQVRSLQLPSADVSEFDPLISELWPSPLQCHLKFLSLPNDFNRLALNCTLYTPPPPSPKNKYIYTRIYLYCCADTNKWLLHVPLLKHDHSVETFEGRAEPIVLKTTGASHQL